MARWITFLIAILLGLALGLYYGWRINPVEYVDASPGTLRIDYKTDYVLMVAEAYHSEADAPLAIHRLALLGEKPVDMVVQAVLFAERNGYTDDDLTLMRSLSQALQAWQSSQGGSG
jgi:hypothetical protein